MNALQLLSLEPRCATRLDIRQRLRDHAVRLGRVTIGQQLQAGIEAGLITEVVRDYYVLTAHLPAARTWHVNALHAYLTQHGPSSKKQLIDGLGISAVLLNWILEDTQERIETGFANRRSSYLAVPLPQQPLVPAVLEALAVVVADFRHGVDSVLAVVKRLAERCGVHLDRNEVVAYAKGLPGLVEVVEGASGIISLRRLALIRTVAPWEQPASSVARRSSPNTPAPVAPRPLPIPVAERPRPVAAKPAPAPRRSSGASRPVPPQPVRSPAPATRAPSPGVTATPPDRPSAQVPSRSSQGAWRWRHQPPGSSRRRALTSDGSGGVAFQRSAQRRRVTARPGRPGPHGHRGTAPPRELVDDHSGLSVYSPRMPGLLTPSALQLYESQPLPSRGKSKKSRSTNTCGYPLGASRSTRRAVSSTVRRHRAGGTHQAQASPGRSPPAPASTPSPVRFFHDRRHAAPCPTRRSSAGGHSSPDRSGPPTRSGDLADVARR